LKHIENLQAFGLPSLCRSTSCQRHRRGVAGHSRRLCEGGVPMALSEHFARGGAGAEELARLVIETTARPVTGR